MIRAHLLAVIQVHVEVERRLPAWPQEPAWLDSRRVSQRVDPAGHGPTEKVGCQKLSGQKKTEVKY